MNKKTFGRGALHRDRTFGRPLRSRSKENEKPNGHLKTTWPWLDTTKKASRTQWWQPVGALGVRNMVTQKLPLWLRFVLLVGVVGLVSGASLIAYRYYTRPVTLSVAVGSIEGDRQRYRAWGRQGLFGQQGGSGSGSR